MSNSKSRSRNSIGIFQGVHIAISKSVGRMANEGRTSASFTNTMMTSDRGSDSRPARASASRSHAYLQD
jgi:hypothetical protein